jgi:DNA polymerase-3 subunit delta'
VAVVVGTAAPSFAGEALAGIDAQPHAKAVLLPALPPGLASHAYLFHGPSGSGKAAVARGFATELLADGARDRASVAGRVARGTHPDLTWVAPSGAAEMLVSDIDGPVVGAASLTPFEARRRVFVIEKAQKLNESAANRLLKTLEEPLPGVHLILLADDLAGVMATIASRCQSVRFEAPSSEHVAAALAGEGVPLQRARACARLALGDGDLAVWLAGEEGARLREQAEALVGTALHGTCDPDCWRALLAAAKEAGRAAAEQAQAAIAEQAQRLPPKEARRHVREGADTERRADRRRRSAVLDLGLRLAELWLRDACCLAHGAEDVVHNCDRTAELQCLLDDLRERRGGSGAGSDAGATAGRPGAAALARAVELVAETRMRFALNVSEELALETLVYRLAALLGS